MAEAKRPGGLYYIGDKAVDANGKEVEDAPPKPEDTPRDKQPGAIGGAPAANAVTMRLHEESIAALRGEAPKKSAVEDQAASGATSGGAATPDELPTIKDLPDHVASLKTVAEVKAMQKRDERVSAEPIYKARLTELKEEK